MNTDLRKSLTEARAALETIKQAFQPAPPMPDPSMASGAANMGPPPGMPMDPSMGGAPPMDPAAAGAPPGAPPPPGQAPPDIGEIAAVMEQMAGALEQITPIVQQVAQRQEQLDQRMVALEQSLSQPEVPAGAASSANAPVA